MGKAEELVRLAERVEKATGPDRELDGLLFKATQEKPGDVWSSAAFLAPSEKLGVVEVWCRQDPVDTVAWDTPPHYTASVDAALTLVPKDWFLHMSRFSIGHEPRCDAHVYQGERPFKCLEANAATLPLAIIVASLRARAGLSPATGDALDEGLRRPPEPQIKPPQERTP